MPLSALLVVVVVEAVVRQLVLVLHHKSQHTQEGRQVSRPGISKLTHGAVTNIRRPCTAAAHCLTKTIVRCTHRVRRSGVNALGRLQAGSWTVGGLVLANLVLVLTGVVLILAVVAVGGDGPVVGAVQAGSEALGQLQGSRRPLAVPLCTPPTTKDKRDIYVIARPRQPGRVEYAVIIERRSCSARETHQAGTHDPTWSATSTAGT